MKSGQVLTLNNIPIISRLPTLFTPETIGFNGDTFVVTDNKNGAFVDGYQVFDGNKVYWHTKAKPLKIQDFGIGEHSLTVTAVGKGFNDSTPTGVYEYGYYE